MIFTQIHPNIAIIKDSSIFKAKTEAIVNPVNTVGVCGMGLAKQFKEKYPDNYEAYRNACETGLLKVGETFTYCLETKNHPSHIINFPTKNHWRYPSKIHYIEAGLKALVIDMKINKIKSVAIPKLGCGEKTGQLKWVDVKPLIISTFLKFKDLECVIYE